MNREKAVELLKNIDCTDIEQAHIDADDILLEFLEHNEFKDVEEAYRDVEANCNGFWYA